MMDVDVLLDCFVKESCDILKENLVGIYLHGSMTMGCFNPAKSDIDFIIVVNDEVSNRAKCKYMDMAIRLDREAPSKGLEFSIVKKSNCYPFTYPTPFELHFSKIHMEWYNNNPDEYIEKMQGTDKDLAAHFTIIKHRGKCLYGLPIEDVFDEVSSQDYMDSIWHDIKNASEEIVEDTMYLILNLTRVLAYKREQVILSKKEGGEWGIKNLPEKYHPLITAALYEYLQDGKAQYNMNLAKDYAGYMLQQLELK